MLPSSHFSHRQNPDRSTLKFPKQRFIHNQDISREADKIRACLPANTFPVDVESICDSLDINLTAVISLKYLRQIDAFISSDFSVIYIDSDEFNKNSPRLRFTIAHELGHFALHRNSYPKNLDSLDKILAASSLHTSQRAEIQANIFASCLLIPESELSLRLAEEFGSDFKETLWRGTPEEIAHSMQKLAKHFGVSREALRYRIDAIYPDLLIPGA